MNTIKFWHKELSNIHPDAEIHHGCVIHSHVWIGAKVKIGINTKVQAFAFIPDGVTIGKNCFIGPRATFTNDKNPPSHGKSWSETFVGNNVVIGAGAVILPGITLNDGCVIGAGAVVTKDVPSGEIWVGNPASKLDK